MNNMNPKNFPIFFTTCWALTIWIHQLRQPAELSTISVLLFILSGLTVLNPTTTLLVSISVAQILHLLSEMPQTSNHWFFMGLISLSLISTVIRGALSKSKENFTAAAAPLIKSQTIILYYWTVIHKLNYSFINPSVSCAIYAHTHNQLLIPNFFKVPLIILIILVETAIPLLLLSQKRVIGIYLGISFHYILGVFGFYDFSTLMIILLLSFGQVSLKVTKKQRQLLALFMMIHLPLAFRKDLPSFNTLIHLEWAVLTYLILPKLYPIKSQKLGRLQISLIIFPLIVFLNGLSPYLGLKTQTSFSMYSNLSTEFPRNNHFFLNFSPPASTQRSHKIIKTDSEDLSWYMKHNYLITSFELNRYLSEHPNTKIKTEPPFKRKKNNPLLQKIFSFRPVESETYTRCTH